MNLKRNLKIFWVEHSDPILFWSIVFLVVIFITQSLNFLAKANKEKETANEIESKNIITITKEEDKDNKEIIEKFLKYCADDNIKEAYSMLSENCKNGLYPTQEQFKTKYYNKIFNQKRETKVEIIDNETYKITFLEDILESGKIDGRESLEDYYKIEQYIGENKIYINAKNTIK